MGTAAVVAALFALAVPGSAVPQLNNLVVDTTADGDDGECANDCTLREAIALADTSSGRWVQVPPGVYRVTRGPLVIGNDYVFGASFLNNRSAGARTTVIDARGPGRVVQVPSGSSALVAGVTITGGSADTGGGVLVEGGGELTLYDTIVEGNTATSRGGGIASAGNVIAWTSTIAGNTVTGGPGGAIAVDANSEAFLFATTVTGNRAPGGGGGVATRGALFVRQSTIARNVGSGVLQEVSDGATTSMNNSLLADNEGGACGGAITSVFRGDWSGNLDDDGTCVFGGAEGTTNPDPVLGALRNNGGPTDTHALAANSPAVNAGDPQQCGLVGTDQRHAAFVGPCDIGAFEFGGTPPEADLPPPIAGETVNVNRSRGIVKIRLPGSDEFFELKDAQQVPVGSTFDTSKGRVNFVAAGSQRAWFYRGVFKFKQTKASKPLTTLTLTGRLNCGRGGASTAAKKKKRRLWGDGRGKFRTQGEFSSATVRGTRWLVEDRCSGTLTRVKKGRVAVKYRGRTINLRAGQQFLAKRRR